MTDEASGLDWEMTYAIIVGICSGLHYLHKKHNIVHMDLKPGNILLDDVMVPKIADFGTSRLIDRNKTQNITINPMGTPGYMAPEYFFRGSISPKADTFSLGVIILELMAGSRPEHPLTEESVALFTNKVVQKWNGLTNAAHGQHVKTCLSVGLSCIDPDPHKRPPAGEIINKILNGVIPQETGNKVNKVAPHGRKKKFNEVQDSRRLWTFVKITPKIAILALAFVLVLLNPSNSWLLLVATEAVILILWLQNPMSSWQRGILFSIGAVLATVLILLRNSSSWSLDAKTLNVLTSLVTLLSIGLVDVALVLYLQNPRRSSRSRVILFTTGAVLAAVTILMNPSTLFPLLVTTLKFVMALITIPALGLLFLYLLDPESSWRQVIFILIGAALATVLILVNPRSLLSWMVMALKVIMTPVTLLAIGAMVVALVLCQQNPRSSWPRVILFATGALLAAVLILLDPSSSWSGMILLCPLSEKCVLKPTIWNEVKAPATLLAIGAVDEVHNRLQQNPRSSWPRVMLFAIKALLSAKLILLLPSCSWSWVVPTLKVDMALVTIFFIIFLIGHLVQLDSRTQRVVFFAVGAVVAALLILLNPKNLLSWLVAILKIVMAPVNLFAIGDFAVFGSVAYLQRYHDSPCPWLVLLFPIGIPAGAVYIFVNAVRMFFREIRAFVIFSRDIVLQYCSSCRKGLPKEDEEQDGIMTQV